MTNLGLSWGLLESIYAARKLRITTFMRLFKK